VEWSRAALVAAHTVVVPWRAMPASTLQARAARVRVDRVRVASGLPDPRLHPAVYKSRHDHAAGCVDLECCRAGPKFSTLRVGPASTNSPLADQQSTIRNNAQIAQFAPRRGVPGREE